MDPSRTNPCQSQRTGRRRGAGILRFRRLKISGPSGQRVGVQPFLVFEQGAKRTGDLTMLITFRTQWESTGIEQGIAPKLNNFRLTVYRSI